MSEPHIFSIGSNEVGNSNGTNTNILYWGLLKEITTISEQQKLFRGSVYPKETPTNVVHFATVIFHSNQLL